MRTWNGQGMTWDSAGTDAIVLQCRFITPVMGGGAIPKKPDERSPIRVPSIRGQLRFWWRATHRDLDLETLRDRETQLFGGVGGEPTASALSVHVTKQPRRGRDLHVFVRGDAFKLTPGVSPSLAYGAFPLRGTDPAKSHEPLVEYDDPFEITLRLCQRARSDEDEA